MTAISLFLRQREQSRQTLITFSHKASTLQARRASSLRADRARTAVGGSIVHIPGSKSQLKVYDIPAQKNPAIFLNDSPLSTCLHPYTFCSVKRRELKETPSSNWKIPCQAIMFGVSEKRPTSNWKFCIYQSRLA
ncbi:hypothetical protein T07_10542 [Trichinella nelsoni]|uniref:Uncharacterized protein n=1 Tax=Trichinella nelsoni TaxID=6336 RepID=A0A0V0RDC6_9BILA|nr:hypothetical protein T07_10542 [Trichinella nelsoni]